MNPSLDLRVRSMIRALTEVILPALDPENSLAQEQSRLLVGHLQAMLLQLPHATRLAALEITAQRTLAERLVAASAGGPLTAAATHRVQAVLKDETLKDRALKDIDWSALSHAVEDLIVSAADGTPAFKQTVARLVLEEAKASSLRGRTWFKLMNFDADPAKLSDIPTMLNAQEAIQHTRNLTETGHD